MLIHHLAFNTKTISQEARVCVLGRYTVPGVKHHLPAFLFLASEPRPNDNPLLGQEANLKHCLTFPSKNATAS